MSTRRFFVKLATISGAAALLPDELGAAARLSAAAAPSSGTRGRFLSQLGQPFLVEDGHGARVRLVLVEVSDPAVLGAPGLDGHPECFSASFLGPADGLRQGTHAVANAGLGRLSLFLVPVGRPHEGAQRYEAAFNCLVPSFGRRQLNTAS
jgi:hypothetical protein